MVNEEELDNEHIPGTKLLIDIIKKVPLQTRREQPGMEDKLVQAYEYTKGCWEVILQMLHEAYGIDHKLDRNFDDTPHRIAKSLIFERCSGLNCEKACKELLSVKFPSAYNGFIITSPLNVNSLCPHHFENVNYRVIVGYVAKSGVVGLSKIGRVIKLVAQQPILQEDYTMKLADIFMEYLDPEGVGVIVDGQHNCMVARGLQQPDSAVTMVEIRGTLLENPEVKNEFLRLAEMKLRG